MPPHPLNNFKLPKKIIKMSPDLMGFILEIIH